MFEYKFLEYIYIFVVILFYYLYINFYKICSIGKHSALVLLVLRHEVTIVFCGLCWWAALSGWDVEYCRPCRDMADSTENIVIMRSLHSKLIYFLHKTFTAHGQSLTIFYPSMVILFYYLFINFQLLRFVV